MPGKYDANGVQMDKFFTGPDGEYNLKIVDVTPGTTGNGDPKVVVDYEIVDGPSKGLPINYHTITFFRDKASKGAGITLKFLKAIGEPYEGEFEWNEKNWMGRHVRAMVVMEEVSQGKNAGKKFPKIAYVMEPEGGQKVEEVPF